METKAGVGSQTECLRILPVNDFLRMKVRQGIAQLVDVLEHRRSLVKLVFDQVMPRGTYAGSFTFAQNFLLLHATVEFTAGRIFEQEEDALVVVKESVEPQDVWMPEEMRSKHLPDVIPRHCTSVDFEWRSH